MHELFLSWTRIGSSLQTLECKDMDNADVNCHRKLFKAINAVALGGTEEEPLSRSSAFPSQNEEEQISVTL